MTRADSAVPSWGDCLLFRVWEPCHPTSLICHILPPIVFLGLPSCTAFDVGVLSAHHHCVVSVYRVPLALAQVRPALRSSGTFLLPLGCLAPHLLLWSEPEFCVGMGLIYLFSQVAWCVLTRHIPSGACLHHQLSEEGNAKRIWKRK